MTNFDDELLGLQRQAQASAQMQAIRERCEVFLRAYGFDLDDESEERRFTVVNLHLKILDIALFRAMIDVYVQHGPAEEAAAFSSRMRLCLITQLWHEGLWVEPWISLINREFPGPELTRADFEQIIAAGPKKVEDHLRSDQEYEALIDEMVSFLVERGYNVQGADLLMLPYCVLDLWVQRHPIGSEPERTSLGKLFQMIHHEASDPDHPAWQEFVDYFFPFR